MSDLLLKNLPFIIIMIFMIMRMVGAVKRGVVKEICSIVSIIIASVAVLLIAVAVRKYFNQDMIVFVLTIILLVLLIAIYRLLDLFLTTLKLISKLPVISFLNKILGMPLAVLETVILVWALYCVIIVMDIGMLETWIMDCVRVNPIMLFLYRNNYLLDGIVQAFSAMKDITLLKKLNI